MSGKTVERVDVPAPASSKRLEEQKKLFKEQEKEGSRKKICKPGFEYVAEYQKEEDKKMFEVVLGYVYLLLAPFRPAYKGFSVLCVHSFTLFHDFIQCNIFLFTFHLAPKKSLASGFGVSLYYTIIVCTAIVSSFYSVTLST